MRSSVPRLSESCRLMQGSSKAPLFRSGAANDESDGFRPVQRVKDGCRQFGWHREKALVPRFWDGGFIFLGDTDWQGWIWVVPRAKAPRPNGMKCFFYIEISIVCVRIVSRQGGGRICGADSTVTHMEEQIRWQRRIKRLSRIHERKK